MKLVMMHEANHPVPAPFNLLTWPLTLLGSRIFCGTCKKVGSSPLAIAVIRGYFTNFYFISTRLTQLVKISPTNFPCLMLTHDMKNRE